MSKLFDRPHYTGDELKPFEGRPKSMDAFSLPSLHQGKRIPATPPKPMMTGKLKERVNQGRD